MSDERSIRQLAGDLAAKRLSAVELTDHFLKRIAAHDERLVRRGAVDADRLLASMKYEV